MEEQLHKILSDLKVHQKQQKASIVLNEFVQKITRELQGEPLTRAMNDLNRRIFELVHSNVEDEKIGGILAISVLLDESIPEESFKITRFANYLRNVVSGPELQVMILASKTMGKLASSSAAGGASMTSEFVEFEVKRALEWLSASGSQSSLSDSVSQTRKISACLLLKELLSATPTILYSYSSQILELLWIPLRDPNKPLIREYAGEALDACLEMIQYRDSPMKIQWYKRLFDETMKGFKHSTSVEYVHSAVLSSCSMLNRAKDFMASNFSLVSEHILKLKDHKDFLIRKAYYSALPVLTSYAPDTFISLHLHSVMQTLLLQIRKDKDRPCVFSCIGKISLTCSASLSPYLDSISSSIKDTLLKRGKISSESVPVFQCISMMSVSSGQALTRYMQDVLEVIFPCPLSEAMAQALSDLGNHVLPLLPTIQNKLLDLISVILFNHPYKHPGVADKLHASTAGANTSGSVADTETIVLALNILGSFNFKGHLLNEFVRDVVTNFVDDDLVEIRQAAAKNSASVMAKSLYMNVAAVNEVLDKLLSVGVTDPEPSIRQTVFEAMDSRFDFLLAQPHNIRSLFIALNDEIFTIRELAINIIGRLTTHNPAYVMPSLRKTLIQLLTELEYSIITATKEESSRLLSHLIRASQRLIKPYVEPILQVLLPKIADSSPGVSAQIFSCIGELAEVGRQDLTLYLPKLMPILLDTIQDQSSSSKREAALKTLGQLCSNTNYVMDAYIKYPNLLPILMNIIKTEQIPSIRREVIKVVGIIGALDPYRNKMVGNSLRFIENIDDKSSKSSVKDSSDISMLTSSSNDDFYPMVATNALMKILKDPSLTVHHTAVIQAIMYVFKTLGMKCVPFLGMIMGPFLSMMKTCPAGILEFHFQQLGFMVSAVKQHIRPYLNDIFALIKEYWGHSSGTIQLTILSLIEAIASALEMEFKVFLPALLPQLLLIFENEEVGEKKAITLKALHAFAEFGNNLEEYLHLVIPSLIKLFERNELPFSIRKAAIQTVGILCRKISFVDYASRIVHPLVRILQTPAPLPNQPSYAPLMELKQSALDTMCALVFQMNMDFVVFIPMIQKVIVKNKIVHPGYELIISKLLRNESLPQAVGAENEEKFLAENAFSLSSEVDPSVMKKLPVNQNHLKKAWETSQRSTKEDWSEWMRRLSVELLKESPSHALRACASLASVYYPLAKELFNAAFVSCWTELYDQFQDELVRSLESAIISPSIPPETLQTILNLAEFMEHDDKALPIDMKMLGAYAAKCHAYAKALHYKEQEFINESNPEIIEALISINNQLQQPDAAIGVLTHAQQHSHNVELKESWYEKLQRWEDALNAYEKRQAEDPSNLEATLGTMRCLHALGEWENLSQLTQEKWFGADDNIKKMIAPLGAAAAWGMGQWEMMDDYINLMTSDSNDGMFFRSILHIHRSDFLKAQDYIIKTRDLLDTELKALVGESYSRAYNVIVKVQMLAELEEIIDYKKSVDSPDRQKAIRETWMKRLKGCQRNVEVWQRILKLRSLVISPKENIDMWIKFSNLCRKSGRYGSSLKILSNLLQTGIKVSNSKDIFKIESLKVSDPRVVYAYFKYLWGSGNRKDAYGQLKEITNHLLLTVEQGRRQVGLSDDPKITEAFTSNSSLLARSFLKLGKWKGILEEQTSESSMNEILEYCFQATKYDSTWYKAWHSWALANFEVVSLFESSNRSEEKAPLPSVINHVSAAVQGFFKSISLSQHNSLQDTLRLLTLWFKYGYEQDVSSAVSEGFSTVTIDTWLHVIPQLIARIHSPSLLVRRLIHQLLSDVGKEHPQALIYPLTVASKSQSNSRKDAALSIMEKMKIHSSKLVDQALLVSQELIRVAILWHEMWHEGLEEASRLYFGEHNVDAMFTVLKPLHDLIERGPETLREISFNQAFGRDLQEAMEWGKKFQKSSIENDLHQAWDLYYHVFRRINKQLPQLTTLELKYVSPQLMAAKDLELAIPGTYKSGEDIIRISSFAPTLSVITSKQRPRKLSIKGSDGKDYQYLLKGHEDLRQDERVMQLFGLVNSLLGSDPETFKRHLSIHRYPVLPLSPNSGLLGWVDDCDTLHALIRDYRESRKILLNIEHRLMLQMAPDYDNLTLMQKVEVFQYALDQTTGHDLAKVLWLKSKNSESWLDRRTTYTRSLAVMSMVGYILGLGDRHPSNLMLERFSGKVIHIDFGDCFEVAMHRDKFPEKIPFRLTRMLVTAMEISGIEGSFRTTCENVMRVLRNNKESLMAVLEAFVHDPLINWRLLRNLSGDKTQEKTNENEVRVETSSVGTEGRNSIIDNEFLDEHAPNRSLASRKIQNDELEIEAGNKPEVLNARALAIVNRVSNKLKGRDFKANSTLEVSAQVDKLILQAMAIENLCQCYIGWCPFW